MACRSCGDEGPGPRRRSLPLLLSSGPAGPWPEWSSCAATSWTPRTVAGLSDQDVADRLARRHAYVEVDGSAAERLPLVARAYRHDWVEALRAADLFGGRCRRPGCGDPDGRARRRSR